MDIYSANYLPNAQRIEYWSPTGDLIHSDTRTTTPNVGDTVELVRVNNRMPPTGSTTKLPTGSLTRIYGRVTGRAFIPGDVIKIMLGDIRTEDV